MKLHKYIAAVRTRRVLGSILTVGAISLMTVVTMACISQPPLTIPINESRLLAPEFARCLVRVFTEREQSKWGADRTAPLICLAHPDIAQTVLSIPHEESTRNGCYNRQFDAFKSTYSWSKRINSSMNHIYAGIVCNADVPQRTLDSPDEEFTYDEIRRDSNFMR